jgi:sugar phosphate isomerase/epimerase
VYIHDAFEQGDVEGAKSIFDYARRVGFAYINGQPKRAALPMVSELVPQYGIDIAIHNHGPGFTYQTLEHVTEVLTAHPRIKACVDIGHFARSRVDPVRAIRTIGPRSIAVHIKDIDSAGENTVLGEGTIDLPAVFAALVDVKFDGLVVLEYEGDFDDMTKRLDGMRRSLVVMERLIAGAPPRA